jgi:hypothetical protein
MTMRNLVVLILLGITSSGFAGDEDPQNVEVDVLGAAVREAGYGCNTPSDLVRTREGVAEGLAVWLVTCDGVRLRVTIHGDTGSTVVPVE